MGEERIFELMESFLKENEYPLIHTMKPEQIADIFHISNRCFLVSWLLNLLEYDALKEFVFDQEDNKVLLSNLVYGYGFCSEKDKLGFINGELPAQEQVRIIFRMCKFISKAQKTPKQDDVLPVPIESISNLIHKDVNLFPQFGPIKIMSEEQIRDLENEVDLLENMPNNQDNNEIELPIEGPRSKKEIDAVVCNSDRLLSKFNRAVIGINQGRDCLETQYKINPEASDIITTCSQHIDAVSKHILDLKAISNISTETSISNENCCYAEMVNALFKQSVETPFFEHG